MANIFFFFGAISFAAFSELHFFWGGSTDKGEFCTSLFIFFGVGGGGEAGGAAIPNPDYEYRAVKRRAYSYRMMILSEAHLRSLSHLRKKKKQRKGRGGGGCALGWMYEE